MKDFPGGVRGARPTTAVLTDGGDFPGARGVEGAGGQGADSPARLPRGRRAGRAQGLPGSTALLERAVLGHEDHDELDERPDPVRGDDQPGEDERAAEGRDFSVGRSVVDREARGVRHHGHGHDGAYDDAKDEHYVAEAAARLPAVEVVGTDLTQEEGQQRGGGPGLGDDVGPVGDGDVGLDVDGLGVGLVRRRVDGLVVAGGVGIGVRGLVVAGGVGRDQP